MKKKKIFAFSIALTAILTMGAIPALAYEYNDGNDHSWVDVRISGTGYDCSYMQRAYCDNDSWYIDLDPDYDRGNCVLKANLENSEGYSRGYMEVYESTRNDAASTVTEDYDYRFWAHREYWYDGYATFQGHWDFN